MAWEAACRSTSRWLYRFCIATLLSGIDERDVSLASRFNCGRMGSVAERKSDGVGF